MMSLAIKRFDFDRLQDFHAPPPPIDFSQNNTLPEAEDFAPPPPPSFSEEELNAAKVAAHQAGQQEGIQEEAKRQATQEKAREEAALEALKKAAHILQDMQAQFAAFKATQTEELSALVLLLVKKMTGDLLDTAPHHAVESLIQECLGVLQNEPKIIIQVHPDVFEIIENKLRNLSQEHHLESSLTLNTNPQLSPSEANIHWNTGSAARNMQSIWAQVEQMVSQINFAQLADGPAHKTTSIELSPESAEAQTALTKPEEVNITDEPQQGESNE